MPHVHNAQIAGHLGYLELEKLAGYPESSDVRAELDRLLALRSKNFSKDAPDAYFTVQEKFYCRTLNVSQNFMYLVPELGQYLHDNALTKVQEALNEYEEIAPYWFVSKAEVSFGEATLVPLYDTHALFMAKSLILQELSDELMKYLDVPAFERGDLFYINKLVATIESQGFELSVTPSLNLVDSGGVANYDILVQASTDFTANITLQVTNPSPDLNLDPSLTTIVPPGEQVTLTVTHTNNLSSSNGVFYTIPIIATGDGATQTASVSLLINGHLTHLPIITKSN